MDNPKWSHKCHRIFFLKCQGGQFIKVLYCKVRRLSCQNHCNKPWLKEHTQDTWVEPCAKEGQEIYYLTSDECSDRKQDVGIYNMLRTKRKWMIFIETPTGHGSKLEQTCSHESKRMICLQWSITAGIQKLCRHLMQEQAPWWIL